MKQYLPSFMIILWIMKKKISINIQIKLSVVVDLYHLDLGRMNTSNLYCNMNEYTHNEDLTVCFYNIQVWIENVWAQKYVQVLFLLLAFAVLMFTEKLT